MEPAFLNYINRLQTIVHLEPWEVDLIAKNIFFKSVKKNTILKQEGSTIKELYFVVSGCVRVYNVKKDNQESTRSISFENTYCWAINFLNNLPIHEYIEALADSELLVFTKEKFYHLVDTSPNFRKVYMISLENIALIYASRVEGLLSLDAYERYQKLLSNSPDIVLSISNKIVASYLGITEQSLSRIKARR
ncbi:MAG: Crp/Fnr family transcriptional regulator [Chitinophagaceae bacterium]